MFNIGFEIEVVTELEKEEVRACLKKQIPEWHTDVKIVRDYTFSGWELVTKPFPQDKAILKLKSLLAFIESNSQMSTDKTTALHVNISFVKNEQNVAIAVDTLYSNTNIDKTLKKYGRLNNNYTRSPSKYMYYTYIDFNNLKEITSFLNDKNTLEKKLSELRKRFEQELSDNRKNIPIAKRKYKKSTYFEFRMIGGENYHKKYRSIKNDILHMLSALTKSSEVI